MLVLSCEYLNGTVVATDVSDRDRAEWPPHPARLFSALVSAWGEGGEDVAERDVLQLLETLGPPEIHAPEVAHRTVGEHFVPVNDTSLGRKSVSDAAVGLLPSRRVRQSRTFPSVALPDEQRQVHFVWPEALISADVRTLLQQLAGRVSYLGHSRSLVRLFVSDVLPEDLPVWRASANGAHVLRVPSPGRLRELQSLFEAGQRPNLGATARYAQSVRHSSAPRSALGGPWVTLRFAGGMVPAIEAWPYVAWMLRRALVKSIDTYLAGELSSEERVAVMSLVSGHSADGSPAQSPHAAYAPLANVGFGPYSSGLLLGAAIILPTGTDALAVDVIRAAITRAMVASDAADSRDGLAFVLKLGADGVALLALADDDPRRSLSPARFVADSRVWTSITPVVLDRFPREPDEVAGILVKACRNAGVPDPVQVSTHKNAGCDGAPAARPKRPGIGMPGAWKTAWRDDSGKEVERFGNRPLTHATLTFEAPVQGPIMLGAGRYHGLGMFLPTAEPST